MEQDLRVQIIRLIPVAGPATDSIEIDDQEQAIIGRSRDCSVYIADPAVSRRHVSIANSGNKWILTDLGSRYGTSLNGIQLEPERPTLIKHRDLLKIGPFIFRVSTSGLGLNAMTVTDHLVAPGTIVEAVKVEEPDSLADKRLSLLIEGCSKIFQAREEAELAVPVLDLVLAGTGYSRGAVLLWNGAPDQVEVLASRDHDGLSHMGIEYSRSLLQASASGDMARLSSSSKHQYGQSIAGLGILEALCAPLIIDSRVIGSIYLDVREGEALPETDAAQFCHVASQVASLAISNLKHLELARRQEHLDADLKIAQEAQEFLLPDSHGNVGSIRYSSRTLPGSIVGGDLFDVFEINEHLTGICFGDITGHGIGAALLMTAVLTHLKTVLISCGDPAVAVSATNTYLVEHSSARMFATLWVGVIDSRDHTLRYVDAGHGHWLICKPDSSLYPPPAPGGVVAGVQPEIEYFAVEQKLVVGDRLVLYSDGLVEQPNADLVRFETDRLFAVLSQSRSSEDDVVMSFDAIESFVGGARFTDDTTIASLEIT